jgi:hypothetical protein
MKPSASSQRAITSSRTAAQLETGARSQLQATLSPQQALEIAESLAKAAGKLLGPPAPVRALLQ